MAALGSGGRGDGALPPPLPSLQFAALDKGLAPLERLRVDNQAALQRGFAEIAADEVTLVLPHRLTTLLTHVFPTGLASLTKVTECVELTDELANIHCRTVVYLSLPQVEDVRAIATHAGLLTSVQPSERSFCLLVCGKWTAMCAEVLAHQNLSDIFHIVEIGFGFVPLDSDLVTLGRDRCLYDCAVHGNKSALVDLATALHQLQRLNGQFDHIKYKGELSAFVVQQFVKEEQRNGASTNGDTLAAGSEGKSTRRKKQKKMKNAIHTLVLLDRQIDFASALCTPLTLEALVDELFESRDGFATLPPLPSSSGSSPPSELVLPLNSGDVVYRRVRSLNMQAVSPSLNAEATAAKSSFDRFRATSATASAADVHEFVKNVPQLQVKQASLERLVHVMESVEATTSTHAFRDQWQLERTIMDVDPATDFTHVVDGIEDLIFRHAPLLTVLRLLCLYSVVHDGVPHDALARLKYRLVQAYGHELIFSFDNLDRMGLLRERTPRGSIVDAATSGELWKPQVSVFAEVATALGAIDLEVDALAPWSMAFVTSGYAPLSCLLVEQLLKHATWAAPGPVDASLNKIAGPRGEIKTQVETKKNKNKKKEENATKSEEDANSNKAKALTKSSSHRQQSHVVVVCFVGGVTYMELAALRWLAQFYPTHEIILASTSVINGHSFLQELLERIPSTT